MRYFSRENFNVGGTVRHYTLYIMSEGYKNVILTGLEWLVLPFVLLEREIASCGS